MRKRAATLCCFAVCLLFPLFAKSQNKPPQTAPPWASAKPDTSKEAIIYEQVRGKLRYDADGSGTNDTYARMRVQSYAGVRKAGTLIFNYDSANSSLEIRTIRVTKPDGKTVDAGPDAVQDLTSPVAQAAPTYTDLRQKHVVVPDLSPGDVLEYETVTTYRPLLPGKVWQVWNFISDDTCLDEQVEVDAASKLSLKTTTVGADGPKMEQKGERTVWTWKTDNEGRKNLAALTPFNNSPFPDVKALLTGAGGGYHRRIWITSFSSWSEVSAWYAGLEHDRRTPSPEVRAKAEELTRDAHGDLEKTRAIYNYVARNIRYVSLSFGVGRYQPHAAGEVLAHQYGDCKDKNTLFEAMLEAVGIKASPALLMASGMMDDAPSPMEFDHVITYLVIDGKDIWLDSTLGVAPFGYLLPNVRGKFTLVATPEKGSKLLTIPSELAAPQLYRFTLEGKIDDDRKMDAHLQFETRGDWEVLFRIGLVQSSPEQLQNAMEAGARKSSKAEDLTVSDIDAGDPYDTTSPLRMSVRMIATLPKEKEEKSKDDSNKSSDFDSPFSPKDVDELVSLFLPASIADQGVALGDPKEFDFHVKFTFGAHTGEKLSAKVKTPKSAPVHLVREFAEYEQSWNWEPPSLTIDWRIASKAQFVSKDNSAEYSAFRSAVEAEFKEIGYAMGAPRKDTTPAESLVRYSEAVHELRAGKTSQAQQTLESIVKDAPEFADAWKSLAQVRAQRKNWEGAREAYQKLTALPDADHFAYDGLIRAYMADRMYPDAAATAKKEIQAFPDTGDGQWNLGWAHLEAEEFPEAVASYEAAAKIFPRNARLQILLGRSYAGAHQPDKAKIAFARALEISSSYPTLNDVAYYSAEAGLDLDSAEEQSKRAVAGLEKEVNAVKLEQINRQTVVLLSRMAAYWDTLGWIYFKKHNLPEARKYLLAASDLTDSPTIQMHMGRVEETLGHKDAAMSFYVRALDATQIVVVKFAPNGGAGVPQPPRPLSPDEQEARRHLLALAGSEHAYDEQMKEGSYNRNWKRTAAVPYNDGVEIWERFAVLVAPGPKVVSNAVLPDLKDSSKLVARFTTHAPPQTFPDDTIVSIPRVAAIHCLTNPAQCEFEFLPYDKADGVFVDSSSSQ
jgi:transglutaminase-like putative cysteine protease/tetratricopeptide (TPR) repeat protein